MFLGGFMVETGAFRSSNDTKHDGAHLAQAAMRHDIDSHPRVTHPQNGQHSVGHDARQWMEGNADYLLQAAAGGAQYAVHQVTEHPLATAGLIGLGVLIVAAAPIATAFGAAAAVVTGIDLAVTAGGAALATYGTVEGVSHLAKAANQQSTRDGRALLLHPDGHSKQQLEAARRKLRDNLGEGTFETATGVIGLAGSGFAALRLSRTLGELPIRLPRPLPRLPKAPPPEPPPAHLENAGAAITHPEVKVPPAGKPSQPPSADNGGTDASRAGSNQNQKGSLTDHARKTQESSDSAGPPPTVKVTRIGNSVETETTYQHPMHRETPLGPISFTTSREMAGKVIYSNPDGLGLPGNPTDLQINYQGHYIQQTWVNPGEVGTPYGAMSPASMNVVSDTTNPNVPISRRYNFFERSGQAADVRDPLTSLASLEFSSEGVEEIYQPAVDMDGHANVISRRISPDKSTVVHLLDDLSEHTSVRQPNGAFLNTASTEPLRAPGADTFGFSLSRDGALQDHFQAPQHLGTPYGVMPVLQREYFPDVQGTKTPTTAYRFSLGPVISKDPLDAVKSLQLGADGSFEENYSRPVRIDGVSNVLTRLISRDKSSIRYIREDGTVVAAVRQRDGSYLQKPPSSEPNS